MTYSDRLPSLEMLSALARSEEEHPEQRLALLASAAPLLWGHALGTPEQRFTLADKLERWRYQWLNRCGDRLTAPQRQLVDALDVAARTLRHCSSLPPRNPRLLFVQPRHQERLDQALNPTTELEQVVGWARKVTHSHFADCGSRTTLPLVQRLWRVRLYAPLYLSSYCINHCHYCHFRFPSAVRREHLDHAAALAQAEFLAERGIRHVLLVAGDYPQLTSTDYFAGIARTLTDLGFHTAIEIAPQSTADYARLASAGVCGVTLYQETYQEDAYASCHPRGTKVWFDWRLEGPERAAEAGISRLGLGILLGLGDPDADLRALVGHAHYLLGRFPQLKLAFSLPRLHEAPQPFVSPCPVDDETLVRFYCALRLSFPTAELVLSTRERPELRDRLAAICITQMSAESCTSPGGYGASDGQTADSGQFPVHDKRTVAEIANGLLGAGFSVCFND